MSSEQSLEIILVSGFSYHTNKFPKFIRKIRKINVMCRAGCLGPPYIEGRHKPWIKNFYNIFLLLRKGLHFLH